MNELRQIIAAVDESDEDLFLATVVDVVGSAYRRPTAKMLVLPNQEHIGTISGGCLEREICRAARALTKDGPKLVSFDTRSNITTLNARYNLGCSGIIYVLVERVTRNDRCPIRFLRKVLHEDRSVTIATVYQSDENCLVPLGYRLLREQLPVDERLTEIWSKVTRDGRPICCELAVGDSSTRFLVERLDPPKPFWIFGAGEDARPLAAMATELGWDVSVVDRHTDLLTKRRFPNVRRRMTVQPADVVLQLDSTPRTAAVLMTHTFSADAILLPWLLHTDAHFVGVLGPKSRTAKLMRQLHANGCLPAAETFDRLHTPVGLDLGGSHPGEIAVAVLAEVIATQNERAGGRLHDREQPIYDPVGHELITTCKKARIES